MCILSGDTSRENTYIDANNTNIFVGELSDNRQITVYENKLSFSIKSKKPMAMILPVPNQSGLAKDIKLIDMSYYPEFFRNLHDHANAHKVSLEDYFFPKPVSRGYSMMAQSDNAIDVLPIYKVGSYECSVCGSVDDLDKLSSNFWIAPSVLETIKNKYDVIPRNSGSGREKNFGFIIAQIMPNFKRKAHSLAYTHTMSRKRVLFLPTLHVHGDKPFELTSEFDHTLYTYGSILNRVNSGDVDIKDSYFINQLKMRDFLFPDPLGDLIPSYMNMTVYGSEGTLYKNEDLLAMESIKNGWLESNLRRVSGKYPNPSKPSVEGPKQDYYPQMNQNETSQFSAFKQDTAGRMVTQQNLRNEIFFGNNQAPPNDMFDPFRFQSDTWS